MFFLFYGKNRKPRATNADLAVLVELALANEDEWSVDKALAGRYSQKDTGCHVEDDKGFWRWAPGDAIAADFYRREGVRPPRWRTDIFGRYHDWNEKPKNLVFPGTEEARRWRAEHIE